MSHFSHAPLVKQQHLRQKGLNQTFFIIYYLSTFYLFDDTEKHLNHICNDFASLKYILTKTHTVHIHFAKCIIPGDRYDPL